MINKFAMGVKIRDARIKSGMSVKYVKERLGINREATIYEWENGRFIPCIEHLFLLSKLYNTTMEHFLVFVD